MNNLVDLTGDGLVSRIRDCDREFLEELWLHYIRYADNSFRSELHKNLHPRFWEMYLTVALLKHDKLVLSRSERAGEGGPDTCVLEADRRIWIEAVAPDRGMGGDAVPEIVTDGPTVARRVPDEEIILRYRHGIHEKFRKLTHYRATGVIPPDEPFIIALNGGNVPNARTEAMLPRIIHALFPLGHYTVTLNRETLAVTGEGYDRRDAIQKLNGSPVQTDVFLDPNYAGVSAVLFSYADVCNPPVILGADFVFCHNPYAANPVPRSWLQVGTEYWVENDRLHHEVWNKEDWWTTPRWLYAKQELPKGGN